MSLTEMLGSKLCQRSWSLTARHTIGHIFSFSKKITLTTHTHTHTKTPARFHVESQSCSNHGGWPMSTKIAHRFCEPLITMRALLAALAVTLLVYAGVSADKVPGGESPCTPNSIAVDPGATYCEPCRSQSPPNPPYGDMTCHECVANCAIHLMGDCSVFHTGTWDTSVVVCIIEIEL